MPDTRAKTLAAPILGAGARKTVKLGDAVFAARWREPLVHQTVRAEQAARRRGTAATKTRGETSGGGVKPWRQKGTGRARAGSSRSPIWTGGGTVFGPQPRSYTFKVNRKEHRAALCSALSLHAGRGSIALIDTSAFTHPKTSHAADLLDDWAPPAPHAQVYPALVVLDAQQSHAALSFRNLAHVTVLTPEDVGVSDLIAAASLLASQTALDALAARAGGSSEGAPPALSARAGGSSEGAPGARAARAGGSSEGAPAALPTEAAEASAGAEAR